MQWARDPRWRLVAIAAAIAFGAGVRWWILQSPGGIIASDEAVVGLMAKRMTHGHFYTFFWAQRYGGTLEVIGVAALFRIFGVSARVMQTVPVALSGVAALLVWRVGRRVVGRNAAIVAGLLVWIWPAAYLWWSTEEAGFYWASICLGLVIVLFALRLAERPRAWLDWVVFGLAIGLGWWNSPQTIEFTIPVAAWLLWRLRTRCWPGAALAIGAALLGAAPWLRWNLQHNWGSLDPSGQGDGHGYLYHLGRFFSAGFGTMLGLRPVAEDRYFAAPLGQIVTVLVAAAVVMAAIRMWRSPIAWVALAYPFIMALVPNAGYVGEGRYELNLWPFVALLLVSLHTLIRPVAWKPAAAAALVVGAATITLVGLPALETANRPLFDGVRMPTSITPLARALERHGYDRAFADYWIAYRLTFETNERVLATPTDYLRSVDILNEVRAAPRPVYAFVRGEQRLDADRTALQRLGIGFKEIAAGDYIVLVPDRKVLPEELAA